MTCNKKQRLKTSLARKNVFLFPKWPEKGMSWPICNINSLNVFGTTTCICFMVSPLCDLYTLYRTSVTATKYDCTCVPLHTKLLILSRLLSLFCSSINSSLVQN